MKYAVMSDVHANPEALLGALGDARTQGCGKFVFLGDATGYGYDPAAAVKLVRENFDLALLGNHDSACAGLEPQIVSDLCESYRLDIAARPDLAADDIEWLRSRKPLHARCGVAFSHGDFTAPREWGYIEERKDAESTFAATGYRLMFCGHTHHAQVWRRASDGTIVNLHDTDLRDFAQLPQSRAIRLDPGSRYIVNVGAVGYPRHYLMTTYAIYDTAAETVTMRNLPFDFKSYCSHLTAAGIPLPDWLLALFQAIRP